MANWLPYSRTGQAVMARNWISIINNPVSPPNWGIPPAQMTEFVTLHDTADTVLQKAENDTERTMVVTAQCNAAFIALTDKMRFIKNHYFLLPPLTEADLVSLGLKPADTTRSPIPPPDPAQGGRLPFARTTRRRRERVDLEGNSGKTAWFSLAYRSPNNQIGPFCPPFSAIIP